MTKGEQTAQRILDIAEYKFAQKGFEKTSLREIAEQVGIQEPGLYRHFANKDQLYHSVLERALKPLDALLAEKITQPIDKPTLIELPAQVFAILVEHPSVALLFQQAMLAEKNAQNPMKRWIDGFFKQAKQIVAAMPDTVDQEMLALRIVALFNVCIGFFVSKDILEALIKDVGKDKTKNKVKKNKNEQVLINKHKILLRNIMEAWLNERNKKL